MTGVYAVIPAAGEGRRLGAGKNKLFLKMGETTILERTLLAFDRAGGFDGVVLVCKKEEIAQISALARRSYHGPLYFAQGGDTRQQSVYNGLRALPEQAVIVAVHDAARCFVSSELIRRCVESAFRFGSGVAGRRCVDTVKLADAEGNLSGTVDRAKVVLMETPQVFRRDILVKAYEQAKREGRIATDDSSLVEQLGIKPRLVESDCDNYKITTPLDLKRGGCEQMRIGYGVDAHRLAEGRALILGGVEIPFEKGLDGHSDADVLVHAVMDALLGAAGLGDIGEQFPDGDEAYLGISSLLLLQKVAGLLEECGWSVGNVDATVVAQAPKLSPYKDQMRRQIAQALGVDAAKISVKATTTEKMGPEGRGEGISAVAACILKKAGAVV